MSPIKCCLCNSSLGHAEFGLCTTMRCAGPPRACVLASERQTSMTDQRNKVGGHRCKPLAPGWRAVSPPPKGKASPRPHRGRRDTEDRKKNAENEAGVRRMEKHPPGQPPASSTGHSCPRPLAKSDRTCFVKGRRAS